MSLENVQMSYYECWNCGWQFQDVDNICQHTCFSQYNETKHVLIISTNGVVSIKELSTKEKKNASEIRLIQAYYERPGLYNRELQQTVSPEEREQMWHEIAEAVGSDCSVDDSKRIWRNMRDQFKKAYNKRDPKLFRHFNKMLFLTECDNDGDTLNNLVLQEQPANNHENEPYRRPLGDLNNDDDENNSSAVTELTANSLTRTPSSKENAGKSIQGRPSTPMQRKDKDINKREDLQMLVLEKIKSHTIQKQDPTDMLFSNFSETFKRLDTVRQLRVHRRFIEILEHEFTQQENQSQYISD
ncbi:uncharacterized protein LOC122510609 [Leptopilina heterotoma]|uniref:uncharacterized protein LOC122506768 n=1 Tax=Leptopilina heterotoma TaxID=63436 RepID=UPI001CA8EDFE|nr:uncharacterized protein LOC122506768 [Leptopilina heterotoma]XP_043481315.1 uncharacterized protein LOC122510609 [Leptopilina heterotoma]